MICEIENTFDSDGTILSAIGCQGVDLLTDDGQKALEAAALGMKLIYAL